MTSKRKRPGKQLKAPNLPLQSLEKALPGERIEDHASYSQILLANNDLTAQIAHTINFDQVFFQHVGMNRTNFKRVSVVDSRLKVCDLANAEWSEANITRVELLECHLTGFQASEARVQDTLFKECVGRLSQWAFSKFETVRFEDCDFTEANFYQADLAGAVFLNCNLCNADFSGAKLMGADLRGSQIDGVRVGPAELQGATLDPTQALAFVRGMGITVSSPEEKL